jgi:hypothetical protein
MHANSLQRAPSRLDVGTPIPCASPARHLRVAIFVENDIIYRHFIQSRAFAKLARDANVTFVFAAPSVENKRLTVPLDAAEIGAPIELLPVEPQRVFYWRRLFQVSQLVWRRGAEWKHLRAITRYLIGRNASILYTMFAMPGVYQVFRRLTYRKINKLPSRMEQLVKRLKPDVLVHPTVFDGYFINDFVLIGRRLGIPTVAIMNSWDNPSTKRTVIGQPDWVLVWGPQTHAHAVTYMGLDPSRAISFGAAQFEVYERPPRISREEFCRRHGIDPCKRILLYAGSSKGTDEFEHLRTIDAAIDRGELAKLAVVYRPHPWGAGGYKGARLLDYPWRNVAIDSSMRGYLEAVRAGSEKKYLADYRDTHDVLSSIDALVSPLSTIILEGALHGKPVLCFMAEQKDGSSFDLQKRLVHFEDLYDSKVVFMAYSDDALVPKLAEILQQIGDPALVAALREECRHFVSEFDAPYSERIVDFLRHVAGDAPPMQ